MQKIIEVAKYLRNFGMTCYYVGGTVRDEIMGLPNDDIDICIVGAKSANMVQMQLDLVLGKENVTPPVGAFPVWITKIDDMKVEFALARKEKLEGSTRTDFLVDTAGVSIEDDLLRRDFTMNAMAKDVITEQIIDPFYGRLAIRRKMLTPVSEAFNEDSLRVLRAARFLSRFEFTPTSLLKDYCRNLKPTDISAERVGMELMKTMEQATKPSVFFNFLREVGWLGYFFKELEDCIGVPQSWDHHPEGSSLIKCSPFVTSVTSPTQTINQYFPFRELFSGSFTMSTTIKGLSDTPIAESIVNSPFDSFSGTFSTRSNSGSLSSLLTPAVLTESKGFVFSFGSSTLSTDKVIRVVFKIPKSSMERIMQLPINDFQIFNRIIQPISVFMMDMFTREQFSSEMEHHDNSVESSGISHSWVHNVGISSIIIDSTSMSIDGNIVCSFDLGFNSEVCFTHFKKFMFQYNTFSSNNQIKSDEYEHILHTNIKQGDVYTHTMHCIDAADGWMARTIMLCHDLGKAITTEINGINFKDWKYDGDHDNLVEYKITSKGHEEAGVQLTYNMLKRIHFTDHDTIRKIGCFVELHMIRAFMNKDNYDKMIRRTLRKLMHYDLTYSQLLLIIYCDLKGRPPKEYPSLSELHEQMYVRHAIDLIKNGEMEPIVTGKKLIAAGVEPSPVMGEMVEKALELQDRGTLKEHNWRQVLHGAGFKDTITI